MSNLPQMSRFALLAAVTAIAICLTACTTPTRSAGSQRVVAVDADRGVIESIDQYAGSGSSSGAAGAVVGGVVGGVLGSQVGSGRGRDVATAAGAIGGAVAGSQIQKRNASDPVYRITVRLDDGRRVEVDQQELGELRVGDRVTIEDGRLVR